jgi:hypothetical protein
MMVHDAVAIIEGVLERGDGRQRTSGRPYLVGGRCAHRCTVLHTGQIPEPVAE